MTRKAASGQVISSKNTASSSNDLSLPLDVDAVCLLQAVFFMPILQDSVARLLRVD